MQHIENIKLNEFINGKISKEEISSLVEQAQKSKSSNNIEFDTNSAWKSLKKRIKSNNEKEKIITKKYNYLHIAASIILLIGITILVHFISKSGINTLQISSMQELKEVILPDGSIVSLNKNSTIKFPKKFNKYRIVEFYGEAFFKITKNKKKPFIIKSNNSKITVIGTSFNVNAKNKENISVTVKSGKVKFEKNEKEHIILEAGEFGEIKNNYLSKNKNTNRNFLSWKTKCFEYDGEKLKKVISDFNEVYDVKISTSSADIEDLLISTPFNNKPLEVALSIICKLHNLKYTKDNNKYILSKKMSN